MKNYKIILVFISSIFFGNLAFSTEGIAVIDYNAIFLGTELARERIDDLRDSSDTKSLLMKRNLKIAKGLNWQKN